MGGILIEGCFWEMQPRIGTHRVALPDSRDAPVYVNAKQYHCILRRRQQRAKAEKGRRIVRKVPVCWKALSGMLVVSMDSTAFS